MFSPHAKHQKLYLQLCICVDTGGNNVPFLLPFSFKNAIHLSKSSSIIVVLVTFFFLSDHLCLVCAHSPTNAAEFSRNSSAAK